MRNTRPYRSVAVLAALALLVSAFAPAPLLPCAPAAEAPVEEAVPPCHRTDGHETAMDHSAPEAPHAPVRPQPDVVCCPTKAPLAPSPEQPAPAALGVVAVLEAAALPAPPSLPRAVQADDASPPLPARLHLLFGCFLT
jgi:hypothetical protein